MVFSSRTDLSEFHLPGDIPLKSSRVGCKIEGKCCLKSLPLTKIFGLPQIFAASLRLMTLSPNQLEFFPIPEIFLLKPLRIDIVPYGYACRLLIREQNKERNNWIEFYLE